MGQCVARGKILANHKRSESALQRIPSHPALISPFDRGLDLGDYSEYLLYPCASRGPPDAPVGQISDDRSNRRENERGAANEVATVHAANVHAA